MEKLIKLYGLPRSGTNLLNFLMSLNFEETVCGLGEHNVHYLGWKHGKPSNIETIKKIEEISNVDIKFVFIIRKFEDWKDAILNRHLGHWEFPNHTFSDKKGEFLYSTPMGYELYNNIEELYNQYTNFYINYAKENPTKCTLIYFEDLISNQEKTIKYLSEKFKLKLNYEKVVPVKKRIYISEKL